MSQDKKNGYKLLNYIVEEEIRRHKTYVELNKFNNLSFSNHTRSFQNSYTRVFFSYLYFFILMNTFPASTAHIILIYNLNMDEF